VIAALICDNVSVKSALLKPASACGLRGFTLVELIVATAILVILTGLAVPMARVAIMREKERELRHDLWQLRDAIDRYKDAADRGAFQIKAGSEGYPPDLETLVKGVDVGGKKMRYLRRIPIDPMTNSAEWGLRSMPGAPHIAHFAMCGFSPRLECVEVTIKTSWPGVLNY
jgi:general secretion pathway protein G